MFCTNETSSWMPRIRAALFAAVVTTLGACDGTNSVAPDVPGADPAALADGETPDSPALAPREGVSLATASFAGGIPFGTSALPTSWFGSRYNGALRNIWPGSLRSELAAIKARGGKVVLMFAGNEKYYKDGSGHFSLDKWKQRVNRFRSVDFSSYVKDGTIIGHYLIDEPNDPANWNGRPVSASTVDEMGRYSKQLWPGMVTIVRTEPGYFGFSPRYVDAAWAQYLSRRGNVSDYIRKQVSDAQNRGLQLVVGMNVIKGGTPNGTQMSASEVKNWGSTLLSSSYPCAFISWQYNSSYLNNSGIKDAMSYLRNKAANRSSRSCRGS
jgi:hypothetical protein